MNGLVVGGMPDTMEYYTLFHLALTIDGVIALLYHMLFVLLNMTTVHLILARTK